MSSNDSDSFKSNDEDSNEGKDDFMRRKRKRARYDAEEKQSGLTMGILQNG